jgi:hypothetical protein
MKTDADATLRARFDGIIDSGDDRDWADVLRRRAASQPAPSRLKFRSIRIAAVLAALAAAAAVALVAPWNSSKGSLSDLALAAIGSQPVLHVVAETPTGTVFLDIQSGKSTPIMQQEEIWYDQAHELKHTLTRSGSVLLDDILETPQGGYTPGGIVYDCAWIAAHPIAATKARVSCNASGNNGSTPRVVPRPKPTLNPGLAGFLDGYRQALANGTAHDAGEGQLDGQAVEWLEFQTDNGNESVALDAVTHKPLLVKDQSGWSLRITTIETMPAASANFSRPTPDELSSRPSFGQSTDSKSLTADASAIATAVPGALWAGASVADLGLAAVTKQDLKTSFPHGTRAAETGVGLELDYGSLIDRHLDVSRPFIRIQQAPSRTLGFGIEWGFVRGETPPPGQLSFQSMGGGKAYGPGGKPLPPSPPLVLGFTVINGTYVTIQASNRELLLTAARSLRTVGA